MNAILVMFRPDGQRRDFPISKPSTLIGRGEECSMRVPLSQVSRKHCELIQNNGYLKLKDLGSSNGTYVNGKRVLEKKLKAGDRLQIGSLVFTVQIDGQPAQIEPLLSAPSPTTTPDDSTRAIESKQIAANGAAIDAAAAEPELPEVLEELSDSALLEVDVSPDDDSFASILEEMPDNEESDIDLGKD